MEGNRIRKATLGAAGQAAPENKAAGSPQGEINTGVDDEKS